MGSSGETMRIHQSPLTALLVAVPVAGVAALYFAGGGLPLDKLLSIPSWELLGMSTFLGYVSYTIGFSLVEKPIRASLIAVGIAFTFCYMGANDLRTGGIDEYDVIDGGPADLWTFFRQFIFYVVAMLCGLFIGSTREMSSLNMNRRLQTGEQGSD
jgi:hypothetical protein